MTRSQSILHHPSSFSFCWGDGRGPGRLVAFRSVISCLHAVDAPVCEDQVAFISVVLERSSSYLVRVEVMSWINWCERIEYGWSGTGEIYFDIDAGRSEQYSISFNTGEMWIIWSAIGLIPVWPLPLAVSVVIALVVAVYKGNACFFNIVWPVIARELCSLSNEIPCAALDNSLLDFGTKWFLPLDAPVRSKRGVSRCIYISREWWDRFPLTLDFFDWIVSRMKLYWPL